MALLWWLLHSLLLYSNKILLKLSMFLLRMMENILALSRTRKTARMIITTVMESLLVSFTLNLASYLAGQLAAAATFIF